MVSKIFPSYVIGLNMADTKILQAIFDKVNTIEKTVHQNAKGINETNERLDKIGKSVAYLEDYTPTIKEHDRLARRVTKIEKRLASA